MSTAIAVATLLIGATGCSSDAADPTEVIDGFYAAYNVGDLDGAVEFFAEDASITDPFGTFTGIEGVRTSLSLSLRILETTEISNMRADGEVVTWDETFHTQDGDVFQNAFRAVIEDSKIVELTTEPE